MLAVSMPNVATSPAFVETATKCFATALTSPPKPSSNHARALCALVIVSRGAQGDVQDRSPLRHVDPLSPEHGVDPRAQAGCLRQLEEEPQRLVGDAMLRVIEVDAHRLRRQALAAPGVVREEPAQMQVADLLVVGPEGLPCRVHVSSPWRGRRASRRSPP